ncbi:hypothetical protein HDU97_000122 [Phlyctochytrium planicorne]|nr:hypothetical protein HDU97_000122 [Phlyctochytrium planicorne]
MGRNDFQAFVSKYVLEASKQKGVREEILETLKSGKPHGVTVKASAVLIDISGFTALTTELAKRGKISSELITQAVSGYLSEIISVVLSYNGDVVKFLGDALLVCFDEYHEIGRIEGSEDYMRVAVYKAMACAADVMLQCGSKAIDLPSFVQTSGESSGLHIGDHTKIEFKLHVAVGAGQITHIVVGSPVQGRRCDYCISGDCLQEIGNVLNETLPGELGVTAAGRALTTFQNPPDWAFQVNETRISDSDSSIIFTQSALETVKTMAIKNIPKQNDRSKIKSFLQRVGAADMDEESTAFCKMFINKSLLWKLDQEIKVEETTRPSRASFARKSVNFGTNNLENKSAEFTNSLPRFATSTLISEFRNLSILFIKLNFEFDAEKAQIIFHEVVSILEVCDGFVQQYSVDDKGQSLLCVFGLPPRTHENNAVFAVKAALTISEALKRKNIYPITLAITTNEILYSTLGSTSRCEAGILGNVVNLAARIMCLTKSNLPQQPKFPADQPTAAVQEELGSKTEISTSLVKKKTGRKGTSSLSKKSTDMDSILVLCDDATREAAGDNFATNLLGMFKFKGMPMEVNVWKVELLQSRSQDYEKIDDSKQKGKVIIGYNEERKKIFKALVRRDHSVTSIMPKLLDLAESLESEIETDSHPSEAIGFTSPRGSSFKTGASPLEYGHTDSIGNYPTGLPTTQEGNSADGFPPPTLQADFPGVESIYIEDDTMAGQTSPRNGMASHAGSYSKRELTSRVSIKRQTTVQKLKLLSRTKTTFTQQSVMALKAGTSQFAFASPLTRRAGSSESLTSQKSLQTSRIMKILKAANEKIELAPLLNIVLPWLSIPETSRTIALSAQSKKELLRKFLFKFFAKVSQSTKILLAFDDLQWFDSASLELVQMIVKMCPKIYCVLSTRPIGEYNLLPVQKLCTVEKVIHLKLKGLTIDETQDFLVSKFQSFGVQSIDPLFLGEFYKRSGGLPLFSDQASETLKSKFDEKLRVTPAGMLRISHDVADYEELFIKSVDSAILNAFDQLDPRFQSLLKTAAVFGQHFDLDFVASAMEVEVTEQELKGWIESFDKFNYLSPHRREDESSQHSYVFRHVMIQSAVYNSLPFLIREEKHLRIVEIFEDMLSAENRPKLIPLLSYHALRTVDKTRKIKYLELCSSLYLSQHLLQEASIALKTLITVAESIPEVKGDIIRVSGWWSQLTYAQVCLRQYKVGREAGLVALKLIGINWPQTDLEFQSEIKKQNLRLSKLWIMTAGGRTDVMCSSFAKAAAQNIVLMTVLPAFQEMHAFDPSAPPLERPLLATMYLNASIILAPRGKLCEFTKACVRKAVDHLYASEKQKYRFFLQRSAPLLKSVKPEFHKTFFDMAAVTYFQGDFQRSLQFWERATELADTIGDHGYYCIYNSYAVHVLISMGYLESALIDCEQHFDTIIQNEDHVSQIFMLVAQLQILVLQCKLKEAQELFNRLETLVAVVGTHSYLITIVKPLLLVRQGKVDDALAALKEFADYASQMTPNQIVSMQRNEAQTNELRECYRKIWTTVNNIWCNVAMPAQFACKLVQAAELLSLNQEKKAVDLLRSSFRRWFSNSRKDYGIFRVFFAAVISRFTSKSEERFFFRSVATDLLDKFGIDLQSRKDNSSPRFSTFEKCRWWGMDSNLPAYNDGSELEFQNSALEIRIVQDDASVRADQTSFAKKVHLAESYAGSIRSGLQAKSANNLVANQKGASPVTETLQEAFEGSPINFKLARFRDPKEEQKFMCLFNKEQENQNPMTYSANLRLLLIGLVVFTFYSSVFAVIAGVYYETYITIGVLTFGLSYYIGHFFIPKEKISRHGHIMNTIFIFFFFNPQFTVSYYFSAMKSNYSYFGIFIYGTSTAYLFIIISIVQSPFVIAAFFALYFTLAPWIIVTMVLSPTSPHLFLTIPGMYSVISLTSLLSVYDREIKRRKIYVMEKLLASRIDSTLDDIQKLPIDALIRKSRLKNPKDIVRAATMQEVKSSSRMSRFRKWWRANVLVRWEDKILKERYLTWRQTEFMRNLRVTFTILCIFDLYSSFLYPLSYCNPKGQLPMSPSLCGPDSEKLRNIRLFLPPLFAALLALSYWKKISVSSFISQWLFTLALSIRGLVLVMIYAMIIKNNPKDETHFLILSTIVAMLYVSCGPSLILMEQYVCLSVAVILGAVAAILYSKNSMLYLLLLVACSIPLAGYFNINMEKYEHRFFALWELLCEWS